MRGLFLAIVALAAAVVFTPMAEAQCSGPFCRLRERSYARYEARQMQRAAYASAYSGGSSGEYGAAYSNGSQGGFRTFRTYSSGSHGGSGYSQPAEAAPAEETSSRQLPAWQTSKPVKEVSTGRKCANPDCRCTNCTCENCRCGESEKLTHLPAWKEDRLAVLPPWDEPSLASLPEYQIASR